MVLIQAIICSVSYMTHQTVILSYVTEVVSDMNDQLKEINMLLRVAEMSTMLVFLIGVGVVSIVFNLDALDQAVLGQAVACVGSIAPFYVVVKQLGEVRVGDDYNMEEEEEQSDDVDSLYLRDSLRSPPSLALFRRDQPSAKFQTVQTSTLQGSQISRRRSHRSKTKTLSSSSCSLRSCSSKEPTATL
jgi:hypothetical protein